LPYLGRATGAHLRKSEVRQPTNDAFLSTPESKSQVSVISVAWRVPLGSEILGGNFVACSSGVCS